MKKYLLLLIVLYNHSFIFSQITHSINYEYSICNYLDTYPKKFTNPVPFPPSFYYEIFIGKNGLKLSIKNMSSHIKRTEVPLIDSTIYARNTLLVGIDYLRRIEVHNEKFYILPSMGLNYGKYQDFRLITYFDPGWIEPIYDLVKEKGFSFNISTAVEYHLDKHFIGSIGMGYFHRFSNGIQKQFLTADFRLGYILNKKKKN